MKTACCQPGTPSVTGNVTGRVPGIFAHCMCVWKDCVSVAQKSTLPERVVGLIDEMMGFVEAFLFIVRIPALQSQ